MKAQTWGPTVGADPMKRERNAAGRLRAAVDMLPIETKEAMLVALDTETIVTGAYTLDGGVCPMLAAHRSGGRTSLASFARTWDRYTEAKSSARHATRRTSRNSGSSGAPESIAAGEFSPSVRAAASIMPSVTRLARDATKPSPSAGKMWTLLHWAM